MIDLNNVTNGFYWGLLGKGKDKVLITVYGQAPFLRANIWEPGWGDTGVHVNNIDITRKPLVFLEKIKEMEKE